MGESVKIKVGPKASRLLQINVIDEGEWLTETEHLFDPVDSQQTDEANINHLGIIIARRLLELVEGSVTVKNRDIRGVDVAIELAARPLKG